MKIDKGIKPGTAMAKIGNYGVLFWKEFTSMADIGDSVLIKADKRTANISRISLDNFIKSNNSNMKFQFKKWDEENYRVWRIA